MKTNKRSDWRAEWEQRKANYVREIWLRMMRDPSCQRYTAYYIPTHDNLWGELLALTEMDAIPSGAEIITAEKIPAGTEQQIRHWFERFASHLSVIPANL